MFEGWHKVRLGGIHPWQFIDENDLTLAVISLFKESFQHIESLLPTGRDLLIAIQAIGPHGVIKLLKLQFQYVLFPFPGRIIHWGYGSMLKDKLALEELIDKKCLTNSSPAINRNQLCPVFIHGRL